MRPTTNFHSPPMTWWCVWLWRIRAITMYKIAWLEDLFVKNFVNVAIKLALVIHFEATKVSPRFVRKKLFYVKDNTRKSIINHNWQTLLSMPKTTNEVYIKMQNTKEKRKINSDKNRNNKWHVLGKSNVIYFWWKTWEKYQKVFRKNS